MRQAPSVDGSLELCYWAKSSGHNRLSLLSTEGLKRVLISWLLCTVLRFLCLLVLILITSVTYGVSKSLCKVWLETYQGALLIILCIFDWNVWRILVLDGLLHPHSSIRYVQKGRSIVLYTVSLLSRDSCGRVFISQFMFFELNPLTPNDSYSCRTAPLTSKHYILYIYSTNRSTEYFKHDIYSPFFFLFKMQFVS